MSSQRITPNIIHHTSLYLWFTESKYSEQHFKGPSALCLIRNSSITQIHNFTTSTTTNDVSFDLLHGRLIPRSQRRVPYIFLWKLKQFTICSISIHCLQSTTVSRPMRLNYNSHCFQWTSTYRILQMRDIAEYLDGKSCETDSCTDHLTNLFLHCISSWSLVDFFNVKSNVWTSK